MNETASRLASFLLKKINKANRQFSLISDGDRIAVAVSGGKDSLALLRLLKFRQRFAPEKYELKAIHVLADARGIDTPHHPPLEEWLANEGIEYIIEHIPEELADETSMPCHRCSRIRRKILIESASRMQCNKIAFAHHADDLAETTLLNLIYHGCVETMEPKRNYFGSIELIRPLCLVPEQEIIRFASACEFPPPPPMCPQADKSHRKKARELLELTMKCSKQARDNLIRVGLDDHK
jgi:tRNA 2-thiocytidine biosynthesis protein TtcA